jgi:hypothetical protein
VTGRVTKLDRLSDQPERLCTHIRADGTRCGAYRLRGKDTCYAHSLTPEEWSRQGVVGMARKRNAEDDAFDRWTDRWTTWQPEMLERVCSVISELLTARIEYLGTPDHEMRALGAELALRFFRGPADDEIGPARTRLVTLFRERNLDLQLDPILFGLEERELQAEPVSSAADAPASTQA